MVGSLPASPPGVVVVLAGAAEIHRPYPTEKVKRMAE
jgi:hypothetical protein